uniref:Uncharacterized protein n=1 Tax=Daucus carota subsp. sativus TaxID=79200 RepID=A0A166CJH6_DAUCS
MVVLKTFSIVGHMLEVSGLSGLLFLRLKNKSANQHAWIDVAQHHLLLQFNDHGPLVFLL